jgi:hypothetical protein
LIVADYARPMKRIIVLLAVIGLAIAAFQKLQKS